MELKRVSLNEIKPYESNPRINDEAVGAVAESINQCGYCAPIVVDENMVILAGHTRHKALCQLGWAEAEVVVREGLTSEQKRKYRLLDNKTNELAKWDFALLKKELDGLDFGGFDFGFDTGTVEEDEKKYTSTVNVPQYEIQGESPAVQVLYNDQKCQALIEEISGSDLTEEQKAFLKIAAYRHVVFDYTKIAEFYASTTPECQKLMERSALVILDVDDAIANGYVAMSETIERLRCEDSDA